jgi:hypothetical protein
MILDEGVCQSKHSHRYQYWIFNTFVKCTSLAATKIRIECIGRIEMEKGFMYACIMDTLFLKKKSSRKHWYHQSHFHTHSNNRDMGCGQITDTDSFITCAQMATRAPTCINYSWLVHASRL